MVSLPLQVQILASPKSISPNSIACLESVAVRSRLQQPENGNLKAYP